MIFFFNSKTIERRIYFLLNIDFENVLGAMYRCKSLYQYDEHKIQKCENVERTQRFAHHCGLIRTSDNPCCARCC